MIFEFIGDIQSSTLFNMILENISTNSPSPAISEIWFAFFCVVINTGDIKNLVQISILSNKTKIVEILRILSTVILKAQKRQTIIWKY